jgi:hypothetical protein
MKRVRSKKARAGFTRILRTKDLDRLGIKHKGEDLVWSPENKHTLVMSDQLSDSLVEKLPTEFIVTDVKEDETPKPLPQLTLLESPAGSVQDAPESSVESGTDQVQSSTPKASKKK